MQRTGDASRGGDTGNDGEATDDARRSGWHLAPAKLWGGVSSIGPSANKEGTRHNKMGVLSMSMADHLSLLDWTARQARSDERGSTPKEFALLFARLGISAEIWYRLVKDFGKVFSVVAGQPQRIDERRSTDSSRRSRRTIAPIVYEQLRQLLYNGRYAISCDSPDCTSRWFAFRRKSCPEGRTY